MLVGAAGKKPGPSSPSQEKKKRERIPERAAPARTSRGLAPRPQSIPSSPARAALHVPPRPSALANPLFSVSWTLIDLFPAPVCVGWLPWPVTSGSVRDFFFFQAKKTRGGFSSPRGWCLAKGIVSGTDLFSSPSRRSIRRRVPSLGRACAGEAASLGSARTPARSWKSRRPKQKKEALKKRAILHQKKP